MGKSARCPFCGAPPFLQEDWTVECTECGYYAHTEFWNRLARALSRSKLLARMERDARRNPLEKFTLEAWKRRAK